MSDDDSAPPTFVGKFNSATGAVEWVVDADHDYASELAASGYGDMVRFKRTRALTNVHVCSVCCLCLLPSHHHEEKAETSVTIHYFLAAPSASAGGFPMHMPQLEYPRKVTDLLPSCLLLPATHHPSNVCWRAVLLRVVACDQLQDTERNRVYSEAIAAVMRERPNAHVLDIGTGTGLLAMMAAGAGAKSVTACETFEPMVAIATEVVTDNQLSDTITIVPKRSTDMEVGEGKHPIGSWRMCV